jgi:glycosyltransferase involved in cell wall biosynthesis
MTDLLEEGRIGLLVDVSSPREVADAMLRLASQEGLRQELARSSFYSANKRFQGDVVFDQYEAIYKRVIKPSPILQETVTLASIP